MSDAELTMLAIWRRHLDDQAVGPEDDFYAMGGDSLIALRVVADANAQGLPVELRDILYHPTVRELTVTLSDRGDAADRVASSPGPFSLVDAYDRTALPDGVQDARPATALQVGLIYLCEAARDPRLYHDLIGFEVTGRFDAGAFTTALTGLCRRHEALRSSFDLGGFTEPLQLVWTSVPPPLTIEDPATPGAAARWREAQLTTILDWDRAPLFRCHVAVTGGSFHASIAIHHAIIDGWSFARLVLDLLALYEAGLSGRAPALPELPPHGHAEFVALERAALADPAAAEFWRAEAGVPPLLLDRERFAGAADPTSMIAFGIGPETLAGLRDTAGGLGVPLKSLVLGCHARALAAWTGRDRDVVTGVTVNGRPESAGADALVGLFLNTAPLRFADAGGGWAELAHAALAAEQRSMPYLRYPLAEIERCLGRPAFDVAFNFTHFHSYRDLEGLRDLTVGGWWSFDKTSFPLLVEFMIDARRRGTGVEVSYDPRILPAPGVERYAALFHDTLLEAAAT